MRDEDHRRHELQLVVPVDGARSLAHVAPGSVIVARNEGDSLLCFYEGGIHNPGMAWIDMLQSAAWRHDRHSPTSAMAWIPGSDAVAVATVERDDLVGKYILSSIVDPGRLALWRPQGGYFEGRSSDMLRAAAGRRSGHGATSAQAHAYKAALGAGRSLDEACEALLRAK